MEGNDDEEGIAHDDPRFVEILEACLHMEIAGHKESYTKTQSEIRRIKRNILMKLGRRKELKKKIEDAEDLISTLNVTLKKLQGHVRETGQRIELIEANADDRSKLMSYEMQSYRDIVREFEKTWQSYHARYEEFPLAKKRREAEIEVKKMHIEMMVLEYKIKETERMIASRKRIDYVRTRSRIIEFAKVLKESEKLDKRLTDVNNEIDFYKRKLNATELELKSLREQEEEERKARATQLLEMPPPKINLSRVRLNYSRKWQEEQFKKQTSEIDNDSVSVNTVALEEMCIRDEATEESSKEQRPTEGTDRPPMQIDRELATSFSSRIDKKETERREEVCIDTTSLQERNKKASTYGDNVTSLTRERSFRENPKRTTTDRLSFNYERNQFLDDVHESKRTKTFLRNDEKTLGIEKTTFEEENDQQLKDLRVKETPLPRIAKIEKVQYDIPTLTVRRSVLDTSKSFSTVNFDREPRNESRGSFFTINESLAIKELNASRSMQPSIYGDNSSNFKFSECANISNIADEDINMESVDADCRKFDRKENDKETSPKATQPRFNFSDLLKQKADNFRLF